MKEFVLQLKKDKIDLYKKDYHEMVAAYNREAATTSGYNGRQILELLQNCDDQKSESVVIEVDRENNRLLIANKGIPFSKAGYRSLATSNLSSKIDKTQFIGNKGLGFRSILNWSNKVSIYSNRFKVTYSNDNKEKAFDESFDDTTKNEIRRTYNLKSTIYPIPVLSVPEIVETDKYNEYATVIELNYKSDFLKDIDNQIKAITSETILFLHYIKSIKFIGFDFKTDIHIDREFENLVKGSIQKITNDVEVWDVYQDEGVLPEKYQNHQGITENYQIRIAVPRNKTKSFYKLYSFFATNINLYFPYIIHATFDLDQNRKHLENSDKNKFVVEKLTELMCKMALFKTEDKVDWLAFKLLQYNTENENLQELGFYKELDKVLYEEKIIPCASACYYAQNEVVYLDEDFANLIQLANAGSIFSKHIKPVFSGINFEVFKPRYTGYSNFVKAIDDWSMTITDINVRTQLIKYLVKRNTLEGISDSFNVLLNEKSKVIDKKNEIFTHLNNDLEIPDFCLIEVLHPNLFDNLINVFTIKEDSRKDKARALQGQLKSIANVHSYEFIPLSRKIVNNTHSHFVKEPEKKIDTIKKMISALFNNYDPSTNYTSIGVLDVPLLDNTNEIVKASDLYFSDDYPIGQICLDIFGEKHQKRNQVNNIESLGLENKNVNDVQKFLSWLGVNKFVKYQHSTITNINHSYVRRVVGYAPTNTNVQVLDFEERDTFLENLSAEQFILWVIKDSKLYDNLNQLEKKHGEVVKFKYHTNYSKSHIKSYLAELIQKDFYNFRNHLMDNTFKSINDIEIDYSSILLKKYDIRRKDVDVVLRQLGACSDFNELSIDRIQEILEKINTVYENGRNTSAYYRRAYLHFEENEEPLTKNLKLFAKDHEGLKLFNQDQIYYSDKVKLPNKLRAEFPVFNFPKRSGGKKAIQFFGINDLSEIEIELDDFDKDDLVSKLLHDYLVELYPFILIHRINALDNETTKRKDASKLQQLVVNVCSEVVTKVDNKLFTLDNYEFIFLEDSGYYLKLPKEDNLEGIKKHSSFKDTIADILSHLFDVSGHKSDFRALLSTDLEDVKHITKVNFGEDLLDETLTILGFSNSTIAFWTTIYRVKGLELSFDEESYVNISEINKDLDLSLESHLSDYTLINNESNLPYLMSLFSKLEISIIEFNSYSINSLDLYDFHLKKLTSFFINKFNTFKQSLHSSSNIKKLQENFLQRLHDFEVRLDVYVKSIALDNRFEFSLSLDENFNLFIKKEFGEVTLIEFKDFKDIDDIYEKNKLLLSTEEFEIVESSKKIESLLYFELEIETFKKEISTVNKKKFVPLTNIGKPSNGNGALKESRVGSFKTKSWSGYKNRKRLFNPNESSDKTKSEIGKTSEEKVYNHLCKKYTKEFVHNKAKEDEGLHYDLRYSPDKGNKYIYVEVKTFSKDTFIISREEFEFGKDKKDFYEIWLVKNDEVIVFDHKLEEINLVVKDYYVAFSQLEIA
ncbi:DUF3883 domain-containing protein [Cellulophaga baltica]|uniref:Protein NO VEIN C-terminal domain-containing protein n=1 Tax=Cellulophaga baltica 18 TaxID=1348584 RepID=A0AAU8S419_9FLAO|nr:DUF3883 domain-containing protein [Cellulophaga baltica]AIZ42709.1 hypothetical protein M666_14705 [Cellulophaga baltica 18]